MHTISFIKNIPPLQVSHGANLMRALQDANIPVATSCDGDGICSKCHITILKGKENLSTESEEEKELKEIFNIPEDERISCQTKVLGPATVDAKYW